MGLKIWEFFYTVLIINLQNACETLFKITSKNCTKIFIIKLKTVFLKISSSKNFIIFFISLGITILEIPINYSSCWAEISPGGCIKT